MLANVYRARRRGKPDANADKLPVFSTRSSTRDSRQRASLATASSATEPLAPAADNTHITAGLSARRTQKARNWGKAKSDQQVEHSWGGIATQTRVTSLKPKEEFELTTRLKKYFKLKERYDSLASSLGSAPSIEDFARRLGTDKVSTIAAIMRDGPKQKAAMVRHNMGLVVNIVNKYEHPDVTKEVCSVNASGYSIVCSCGVALLCYAATFCNVSFLRMVQLHALFGCVLQIPLRADIQFHSMEVQEPVTAYH